MTSNPSSPDGTTPPTGGRPSWTPDRTTSGPARPPQGSQEWAAPTTRETAVTGEEVPPARPAVTDPTLPTTVSTVWSAAGVTPHRRRPDLSRLPRLPRMPRPEQISWEAAMDASIRIPSVQVKRHVDALRLRYPDADPARIQTLLDNEFMLVAQSAGAIVGAAAAIPTAGTATAMALTVGDIASFFAAAALYTLSIAELHGIPVDDTERRKALVLAAISGEAGAEAITPDGTIAAGAVAGILVARMNTTTLRKVNKMLTRRFIQRQMAKHGGVLMGRLLPFGIGAAIGVAGGRALGREVLRGAHALFGPPPTAFATGVRRVIEATAGEATAG